MIRKTCMYQCLEKQGKGRESLATTQQHFFCLPFSLVLSICNESKCYLASYPADIKHRKNYNYQGLKFEKCSPAVNTVLNHFLPQPDSAFSEHFFSSRQMFSSSLTALFIPLFHFMTDFSGMSLPLNFFFPLPS